jgi:heme oxygenase
MQRDSNTGHDLRAVLRRATTTRHERLHQHPLLEPILSGRVSLRQYVGILEAFYGIYQPLEERVREAAGLLHYSLHSGRLGHAGRLKCDLAYFGYTPLALAQLHRCMHLPEYSSIAALLGCLYVIEGSMLGGRVIARHVKQTLGLTEQDGCRFFSSYGTKTDAYWTLLCRELHAHRLDGEARHTAVRAANALFAAFERWFNAAVASDSAVLR